MADPRGQEDGHSAGVRPKDITVNKAYRCEQGENYVMLDSELLIFVLAAGSV